VLPGKLFYANFVLFFMTTVLAFTKMTKTVANISQVEAHTADLQMNQKVKNKNKILQMDVRVS
jgi:hypothetical protein